MFPWPWGCLAPFHCDSVSSRFRAARLSLMLPRAICRHAQPVSIQCWSSLGGLCINSHLGWMADPGCPTPTFTDSQFHTSRLFCFFFFLLRRSPTTLFVLILKPIGPFRLIEWFSSQSQILGQPTSPSHWSVQWQTQSWPGFCICAQRAFNVLGLRIRLFCKNKQQNRCYGLKGEENLTFPIF